MRDRHRSYSSSSRKRPRASEEFSEKEDSQSQPAKGESLYSSQEDVQQLKSTPSETDSQLAESQSSAVLPATARVQVSYEEGIPRLLYEGLQSDDSETVAKAAAELYAVLQSKKDKNNAVDELIGLGGHAVLLMVMRKWPDNADIQGKCCSCIAAMIHNWQHDSSLGKRLNLAERLNAMGCMEYVVAALQAFPKDRCFQSSGISAILNLLYLQTSEKSKKAARKLFEDHNGVKLVVNAMHEFPLVLEVQHLGCHFFKRLCELGLGKEKVMKKDVLMAIATAVQSFPNHPSIEADSYQCMKEIMKPARKPNSD